MVLIHHTNFYFKIAIILLFVSTVVLYYAATRKEILFIQLRSFKNISGPIKSSTVYLQQNTVILDSSKTVMKKGKYEGKVYRFGEGNEEIKIAAVLCGERLNQTLVTLKSALIFSKQSIHFILVADDINREKLKSKLLRWPSNVLSRLSFDIHPVNFPEGKEGEEWKKLFKLCACQRLFLPSLLQHIDSLLYIDADVLIIHPVENLWRHFQKMNSSHIAALCPENEDFATGWYNRFARHPFYEPLGVNSGVMLMNLTKMRLFQWEEYLTPIMKEYKPNIVWGDQDIINIIFHFHSEKLYVLPCEWNYRPDHCKYSSVCKSAEKNGVHIIHGSRGVFHNNKQPAFKAIYKAISQCELKDNLEQKVIEKIKSFVKETFNTNCGKHLFSILARKKI